MMRTATIFLSFLVCLILPIFAHAKSEKIAAVVNQDVISRSDVNDRMKLIIVSSGLANNPEIRARLSQQVISSLIDEQIKIQEAQRLELEISQEEIDSGFATIASQNNYKPEEFEQALKQSGINRATMDRQITSQILWGKVVQAEVRPDIVVSDRDIDAAIERKKADKGKREFLIAEIFLPIENPNQANDIKQLANRLVGQIESGQARFFKVAQEFSKAAGASNGGDLGWVQQGQMAPEVDQAVRQLNKDQVSAPIRSNNGYHILFLRDSRQITEETIPDREEMMRIIGTQRLERAQRRYLKDLEAAAFIENRVGS
ncbi:MAG: peptidylprolyl isomerase [Pseudomonadota bacterium]